MKILSCAVFLQKPVFVLGILVFAAITHTLSLSTSNAQDLGLGQTSLSIKSVECDAYFSVPAEAVGQKAVQVGVAGQRRCVVQIALMPPRSSRVIRQTGSCVIGSGNWRCNIDPAQFNIPANWILTKVRAGVVLTPSDRENGCHAADRNSSPEGFFRREPDGLIIWSERSYTCQTGIALSALESTLQRVNQNLHNLLRGVDGVSRFQISNSALSNLGSALSNITVGDFNGDGRSDLIAADSAASSLSVFLGYPVAGNLLDIFLGVPTSDWYVLSFFLTNNVQGNPAFGTTPIAIATADLDLDGKPDLATVDQGDNTVSIYRGEGNGQFRPRYVFSVGTSPSTVALGDVNGDGLTDLVTADRLDNTVSVRINRGDATFTTRTIFSAGVAPSYVVTGDFNSDGNLDLAIASLDTAKVTILLGWGNGAFRFSGAYPTGNAPRALTTDDFNGDGKLDLVAASDSVSGQSLSLLWGEGNGFFRSVTDN